MGTPKLDPAIDRHRWETFVANERDPGRTALALKQPYGTFSGWLFRFRNSLKAAGLTEPTEEFWAHHFARDPYVVVAPKPAPEPTKPLPEYVGTGPEAPTVASPDAITIARLQQQNKTLKADNERLIREAVEREDFWAAIGDREPLEPIEFGEPTRGEASSETVIVFLSDLHWGEVVSLAAMDNVNSYNLEIAGSRLKRCFEGILDLCTRHWPGLPPERIILILGGDLVSGDIHLELSKTNALSSLPAADNLVAHLAAGIRLLIKSIACPVDVISVPGNHGRSTLKPESKNAVDTSYDTLVAKFLEKELRGEEGVTFYVPASGDAVFTVYGWRVLATHGHTIGSRGGTGFVGPAATAARGFKKLAADYGARGTHLDLIIIGHFHCALELEEGFVNGSLVGPNEYGRDNRFKPKPATQLFLSIHPQRGVTQVRRIQVGDESEGTIYAARPVLSGKPRRRVQAVGVRQ